MQAAFWSRTLAVVALAAMLGSVALSVSLARRQARDLEFERVDGYARDVLARSNTTAEQAALGYRHFADSDVAPCSDAEIVLLRQIDMRSSHIQMVGRASGDALRCSSLGVHEPPLALGPVDLVTPLGLRIRTQVSFAFAPDVSFLALERQGFVALIHKSLPIDATTEGVDASLGVFLFTNNELLSSRGHVDPAWLARPRNGRVAHFIDQGMIVSVRESAASSTGAVAAVPVAALEKRAMRLSRLLVPIGLAGGLCISGLLAYVWRKQTAMPGLLRNGLKRGELFVHYQPIVNLRSGQWVGAEALVRWRRSNGELVRPDLFIPVAEESGLIHQVTERVLSLVAADLRTLSAIVPGVYVSVNLSSADLHSRRTVELLRRTLAESGCPPSSLHVEATERGFIRAEIASSVVAEIRALGVRVAIDDFGTGYSSLSHLETIGLDYLKIDKSFIDAVGSGAATSQVVPHIIEMAKSLQLAMIAEGVETEAQAAFLRSHGVQLAQGWLFSRPLPLEAFIEQLGTRHGTQAGTEC